MKNFKLILTMALMLAAGGVASAQLVIPGTNISYRLNGDDWRYLRTFKK